MASRNGRRRGRGVSDGQHDADRRTMAAIARRPGRALTCADAAAWTGLSLDEARESLERLLGTYRSHLAVTTNGTLLYAFGPRLVRRTAKTARERLRAWRDQAWQDFAFLFKIWIATTLIIYVIAFLALIGVALFAQSAQGEGDDRRSHGRGQGPWGGRSDSDGWGGLPLGLWYWLLPNWIAPDPRAPTRRTERRTHPRKRLHRAVFDYVFGPPASMSKRDQPRHQDRQVLAYLRAHQGRMTTAELVALTGTTYETADEAMTRLLVRYDGDPEVQPDGSLVYAFPEVRPEASEADAGRTPTAAEALEPAEAIEPAEIRPTWERPATLPPFTGNGPIYNGLISLMNGFNLVVAATLGAHLGPALLQPLGVPWSTGHALLSTVPLVFSALFFGIPAGRALRRIGARARLRQGHARANVLKRLYSQARLGGAPNGLDELVESAMHAGLRRRQADALVTGMLAEFDAELAPWPEDSHEESNGPRPATESSSGRSHTSGAAVRIAVRVPGLARELAAADRARRLAPETERQVGPVEFSSEANSPSENPGPSVR